MTKLRRSLSPADVVHVSAHSVVEIPLFRDDDDRERFLRLLATVAARYGWLVHGYTLMAAHYDLVVEAPGGTLSAGMQMLNGGYARDYNRRHGRIGHALMGRFRSTRLLTQELFVDTCRHVLVHARRAGICRHPLEWRWSSYHATLGLSKPPPFLRLDRLLSHFGRDRLRARVRLAAFLEGALST